MRNAQHVYVFFVLLIKILQTKKTTQPHKKGQNDRLYHKHRVQSRMLGAQPLQSLLQSARFTHHSQLRILAK